MGPLLGETAVTVHHVTAHDALVQPLHDGMAEELRTRYGPATTNEMSRFPAEEFTPPDGGFVVLTMAGTVVCGCGFHRIDAETAELKRLWTNPEYRGHRLAARTLAEVAIEAGKRGYRRLYLVSGPRQPEAHRVFRAAGFLRLPDDLAATGGLPAARFERFL